MPRRRHAELDISYIGVSGLFMEQFAPVIELLALTRHLRKRRATRNL